MAPRRSPPRQLESTLVALLALVAPAQAAPTLSIPSECGSIEEYQAGIHARLGGEAEALLDALSIRMVRQDRGYGLEVRLRGATRHIEDEDCRALFRAATVVAIALWESPKTSSEAVAAPDSDSNHEGSAVPPPEAGSGDVAPEAPLPAVVLPRPLPASVPEVKSTALTPTTKSAPWSLSVDGRAGLVAGLVPEAGLLLGLEPSLRHGAFDFGVGLDYVAAREQLDATRRGVKVHAWGFSFRWGWRPHRLLDLYAAAYGSLLTGTGKGSKRTLTDHAWALGPRLGIRVRPISYRGISLFLGADGQLEVIRPRFEIQGYREVFRPYWLNGTIHTGVGCVFD